MDTKPKRLGEMLIDAGLISKTQLARALQRQKTWGGRLGSNLVVSGAIKEQDLRHFLAVQTGVEEVDISKLHILPHIIKKVPRKIVEQYTLIPIAMKDKNTLMVACLDPTDLNALDQVSFVTDLKIEPVISSHSAILNAINRYYLGKEEAVPVKPESLPPAADLVEKRQFIEIESMEKHGGTASREDPDLIIFGSQSGSSAGDYPYQDPFPVPEPPRFQPVMQDLGQARQDEFSLDFGPPMAPPSAVQIDAEPSQGFTTEQRMIGLYRVLVKKGLVSEAEIRQELLELRKTGRI